MAKYYPPGFKRDVVADARSSGLIQAEMAWDFGISEQSVQRWLKQARIDDGVTEGTTSDQQSEPAALKPRNRCSSSRSRSCTAPRPTSPPDTAPK